MRRKIVKSFSVVLVSLVFASRVAVAEVTIDVLVAVAPGVSSDSATISAQLSAFMANVHDNSGIGITSPTGAKTYRFRPYLIPALYPFGSTVDSKVAHAWLEGIENAVTSTDPVLKTARNTGDLTITLGVEAYDLVVLVVPEMYAPGSTSSYDCGRADVLYSFPYGFDPIDDDADIKKFSIVISDSPSCRLNREIVIAHELGHILGGDHQLNTPT